MIYKASKTYCYNTRYCGHSIPELDHIRTKRTLCRSGPIRALHFCPVVETWYVLPEGFPARGCEEVRKIVWSLVPDTEGWDSDIVVTLFLILIWIWFHRRASENCQTITVRKTKFAKTNKKILLIKNIKRRCADTGLCPSAKCTNILKSLSYFENVCKEF